LVSSNSISDVHNARNIAHSTPSAVEDDGSWILECMVEFVKSPECSIFMDGFIDENCLVFDTAQPDPAMLQEYQQIHLRYKEVVESLITARLDKLGLTVNQFHEAMAKVNKGQAQLLDVHLLQYISGIDDFAVFQNLMIHRNIQLEKEAIKYLQEQHAANNVMMNQNAQNMTEQQQLEWAMRESLVFEESRISLSQPTGCIITPTAEEVDGMDGINAMNAMNAMEALDEVEVKALDKVDGKDENQEMKEDDKMEEIGNDQNGNYEMNPPKEDIGSSQVEAANAPLLSQETEQKEQTNTVEAKVQKQIQQKQKESGNVKKEEEQDIEVNPFEMVSNINMSKPKRSLKPLNLKKKSGSKDINKDLGLGVVQNEEQLPMLNAETIQKISLRQMCKRNAVLERKRMILKMRKQQRTKAMAKMADVEDWNQKLETLHNFDSTSKSNPPSLPPLHKSLFANIRTGHVDEIKKGFDQK